MPFPFPQHGRGAPGPCRPEPPECPRPPSECKPCPPPCPCPREAFAYLTQSGTLEVCRRSGEIPFCGECLLGGGFTREGGKVRIPAPGFYQAAYTLHLPAAKPLNTVFCLQADGRNLPGSVLRVWKPPGSGSASFAAQVIWEAAAPCTLRLVSSRDFRLDSPGPSDTMATLSILPLRS